MLVVIILLINCTISARRIKGPQLQTERNICSNNPSCTWREGTPSDLSSSKKIFQQCYTSSLLPLLEIFWLFGLHMKTCIRVSHSEQKRTPPPAPYLSSFPPCLNKQLWGRSEKTLHVIPKFLYYREILSDYYCSVKELDTHFLKNGPISDLSWVPKFSEVEAAVSWEYIKIRSIFEVWNFQIKTEMVIRNMTKCSCIRCSFD